MRTCRTAALVLLIAGAAPAAGAASTAPVVFRHFSAVVNGGFSNCRGRPAGERCVATVVYATVSRFWAVGGTWHERECTSIDGEWGRSDGYGGITSITEDDSVDACVPHGEGHTVFVDWDGRSARISGAFSQSICRRSVCTPGPTVHVDVTATLVRPSNDQYALRRYRSRTSGGACVEQEWFRTNTEAPDALRLTGSITGLPHGQGTATGSAYDDAVGQLETGADAGCVRWSL